MKIEIINDTSHFQNIFTLLLNKRNKFNKKPKKTQKNHKKSQKNKKIKNYFKKIDYNLHL